MIKMNERDCYYCIKRSTMYCPNSSECYATQDKPSFRTKELALKEIEQLQNNWNELKEFVAEEQTKISKKCGARHYTNKISPYIKISSKMQELEGNNE